METGSEEKGPEKLAPEYYEDGSSFMAVAPLTINPDALGDFALFDRHPYKDGLFRFRCLLKDPRSMERERLVDLIRKWDRVYIHRRDAGSYQNYVKDNLEFILNHGAIDAEHKTSILAGLSTEVIKDAFSTNFSSHEDLGHMLKHVEKLVATALDFISDIESLKGLVTLIGHDYDTHTHSVKVGWLTAIFIRANQDLFDQDQDLKALMIEATVAGFLHDLGKVKVPSNVLNKPGRLNNLEYILIQSHPAYALGLLFGSPLSPTVMETILYHHENQDGSGYPCGLSGDRIPLMARICHIVDVFDALTSSRPYKKAKPPYEALRIMAGENPYLEALKQFEAEAAANARPPVKTIVLEDYRAKLRRLREREMLEEEAQKRVKARMTLRDKGMAHCFDLELLKRFILTINQSDSFDLSGLV